MSVEKRRKELHVKSPTFGISMPSYCGGGYGSNYPTSEELRDWAVTGEKLGFTRFWHVDRLTGIALPAYNTSWFEAMMTLSSIAPFLKKSGVGTAVITITYRNPLIFAKQALTLDRISKGRLVIGIGQGWNKTELQACNVIGDKVNRFEESIDVLRELLTNKYSTHKGKYWNFENLYIEPRPIQKPRPPILVAGGGDGIHFDEKIDRQAIDERIFRRIARLGDGWIARTDTNPADIAKYVKMLDKFVPEYGKDVRTFQVAHQNFVYVIGKSGSEDTARKRLKKLSAHPFKDVLKSYIIGRPVEVIDQIKKEIEAGVEHFISMPVGMDYELMHFFSDEVIPSVTRR